MGTAELARGEGVTWFVLDRRDPLILHDAQSDPHFINLPVMKEERFHSFMGLPLLVRGTPIGVLCIQGYEPRRFTPDEVRALSAIASQVAPVVDNARLLALLAEGEQGVTLPASQDGPIRFTGTGCSAGAVHGKVARLGRLPELAERDAAEVEEELESLETARAIAREELQTMQRKLRARDAEEASLVFSAQLMFLEDEAFMGRLNDLIKRGQSAPEAIRAATGQVQIRFAAMKDVYFRERSADIEDLAGRLLRLTNGASESGTSRELKGRIVVVRDLTPSRLVTLAAEDVRGVLCGGGGATSHAALLARSLDLPLIVGLGDFVNQVPDGEEVLMDASTGEILVRPPEHLVRAAATPQPSAEEILTRLGPAPDGGGGRIQFGANVSLWGNVQRAREVQAAGIGLYRTEFAFLMRVDLPGEQEQALLYRRAVEAMAPHPVTFRLLDAGGDKLVPALAHVAEPNPFLGYRSLRILLDHPEILRPQLRAILQALEGHSGRILVPMVGGVEDFRAVRAHLADERGAVPLGAMIELPSSLLEIEGLAKDADFLSVGTNDLTQHLLGVDRTNARVTRYLQPCHPALIRALHRISTAALAEGKSVCVCGEMASDPMLIPLWLGLGVDCLSVYPAAMPLLRAVEARVDPDQSAEAVHAILKMDSASAIRATLAELAPEGLETRR